MAEREPRQGLRRALRWLPLVLLALVSLSVLVSGAYHLLSLDRLLASRTWLHAAVAQDRLSSVVSAYIIYVGAVVVSFPASALLTMVCGFLFGVPTGALLAVASATTGAAIVFSIGRGPARDLILRRAGTRLSGLAAGFRRDAFGYVVVLRLLPVFPFWMTNLAPAAFGVPLRTFVLATLVGMVPGAFVYAATGAGIEDVVAVHEAAKAACLAAEGFDCENALTLRALVTPTMLGGLGGLAAFALLGIGLRHRLAKRGAGREA